VRAKYLWVAAAVVLVAAAGAAAYRYYWIHRYDALIARAASVYRLDPALVHSVIHQESYFNPHASSRAGARGLMQVTEPVVVEWRRERGDSRLPRDVRKRASERVSPEEMLEDPEINLHIGSWYLAKMLERFRDEPDALAVALAAYNAGPTNAERWLAAIPPGTRAAAARKQTFLDAIDYPETRRYVAEITERYGEGRDR
jgi:soluble lytic murein transglycosylase